MPSLEELRKNIDGIDDDITRLLHRRAELVLEVKKAKEQGNIDIYSPARERQILDRVAQVVPNGQFPRGALEKIFQNIIGATRSLIGQLNVSFVGPESSLGHEGAVKQFGEDLQFRPEASIDEVFAKVESGDSHYGIVPARASGGSLVMRTFELLLDSPLVVIAEVEVKERLAVIGEGPGTAELQQVFSDAYSFHRALPWIRASIPGAQLELVDNTELAMKMVKGDRFSAAIALETGAQRHGLSVLASGIDSDPGGDARFVVLGQKVPVRTGNDKTSLVCATEERAGALRDVLAPFSDNGITLLKIESRRVRNRAWEYAFFLDAAGHQTEPSMAAAIAQLNKLGRFVKVLGSYPLVCQS